jgi:hypothetical protein
MAKAVAVALLMLGMSGDTPVAWTKPGELRAVVVDRSGQPIPGVTATLRSGTEAIRTEVTDTKGSVAFVGLSPRDYTLTFEIAGFATSSIGPVRMRARESENPELPEFVVMMNPIRVS